MTPAEHLTAIERLVTETKARPNPAALAEIRNHVAAIRPTVSTGYENAKLDGILEDAQLYFANPEKYPGESKDLAHALLFDCTQMRKFLSPSP